VNTIGGSKAVGKTGKERPWKSLRDSHFPTAPTTTSLTIVITFWKIHPPASLRSDD
jgi:hypothetical protein